MMPDLDFEGISSRPAACVSRFRLEQYLAGELIATEGSALTRHLEGCGRCRDLEARLRQEKRSFQSRVPFDVFMAGLSARLEPHETPLEAPLEAPLETPLETPGAVPAEPPAQVPRGTHPDRSGPLVALWRLLSRTFSTPAWVGLAVTAAALWVLLPHESNQLEPPYVGIRSGAGLPGPLEVYRYRNGVATPAVSGETFRAGDRLEFIVRPGAHRYMHLVSVDGEGRLTPFYPGDGASSLALGGSSELLLPGSIALDGYIGLERIFAVFTAQPLPWSEIEAAAARLSRPSGRPLPLERIDALPLEGADQVTFLLVKE